MSVKARTSCNVVYKWIAFKSIRSGGNGGCFLCESEVRLEISHCHFKDVRCEGEGGALYVRNTVLYLLHSCFDLCITARKGNGFGGNVWTIGESEVNVSDISIYQCWIDKQCGDSICVFNSGDIHVKHKNTSYCVDNNNGEDIYIMFGF